MILARLEDLKGLEVVDRDGRLLGTVVDLIADLESNRLRFILIESSALGAKQQMVLSLPIELAHVSRERVQVDQLRDNLLLSPWFGIEALAATEMGPASPS